MALSRYVHSALLGLALASACDPEGFGAGEVALRPGGGGVKLNTNKIGEHVFAELDVTGASHRGVRLVQVRLVHGSAVLEKVWASDGVIHGVRGSSHYAGDAFVGSVWTVAVETEGQSVLATLTITAITNHDGVLVHDFSHTYEGGPKLPTPTCDPDPELAGSFGAVISEDITVDDKTGVVSPRAKTIYIGCLSGGVGKAGYWGYPAFAVGLEAFEAAIRMVRADYCGTGVSFTQPGAAIAVTDAFGINALAPSSATEAVWGAKGALCVGKPRLVEAWDAESVQAKCEGMEVDAPADCEEDEQLDGESGLYWTRLP